MRGKRPFLVCAGPRRLRFLAREGASQRPGGERGARRGAGFDAVDNFPYRVWNTVRA